jgi:CRP-like cAMP-binding protein
MIELPPGTIDPECDAFNVPYSLYSEGSYFGDSDCLVELLLPTQQKNYRDSTAEATENSEVMKVNKIKLDEQLQLFPEIRRYMVAIAKEK